MFKTLSLWELYYVISRWKKFSVSLRVSLIGSGFPDGCQFVPQIHPGRILSFKSDVWINPCCFCQYVPLVSLSLNHGIFQVACSLVFLSPLPWVLSGLRGLKPGFRSLPGFQQIPLYLFPAASMYLWRALKAPLLGSGCRAEMVLFPSYQDSLWPNFSEAPLNLLLGQALSLACWTRFSETLPSCPLDI